jgi:Flp pilus assembly protein CpaB
MRASTLFALTVAIILGLGVATAAKYTGFFNPTAPPAAVAKKADVQILVAARNLFAGDMIDAAGVKVRTLRPEELDDYQSSKDRYLPPVPQAANLRIALKNITADQPILKEYLKDMAKPDAYSVRLLPEMRAINLTLPRDRSAGGLIQVGEWVDVFLTSEVETENGKSVRTACIAPKVRVIVKRNTFWPVFAPLPEGKPVDFTLEVNPYRAALLETTRAKGDITLVPLGGSEQRQLEVQRERLLQNPAAALVHFLPAESREAEDEEARVAAFKKGEYAVSDGDLIRIFGITTPPPPLGTITVERISGAQRLDPQVFSAAGVLLSEGGRRNPGAAPAYTNSDFRTGAALNGSSIMFRVPDCPTCGQYKGKKTMK